MVSIWLVSNLCFPFYFQISVACRVRHRHFNRMVSVFSYFTHFPHFRASAVVRKRFTRFVHFIQIDMNVCATIYVFIPGLKHLLFGASGMRHLGFTKSLACFGFETKDNKPEGRSNYIFNPCLRQPRVRHWIHI